MLTGEQTEERFIQKDAIWFSACPIQLLIRKKDNRVSKEDRFGALFLKSIFNNSEAV